jgi:transcription elongation factor B subunit 1
MSKEETVKLVSAEGFEFVIHRKAAVLSDTLRNMLTAPGKILPPSLLLCPLLSSIPLSQILAFGFALLPISHGIRSSFQS